MNEKFTHVKNSLSVEYIMKFFDLTSQQLAFATGLKQNTIRSRKCNNVYFTLEEILRIHRYLNNRNNMFKSYVDSLLNLPGYKNVEENTL